MKTGKRKFILTENLNQLARWLRILGYDAALYRSISFDNLIRLARKEDRIVLTRSRKQAGSAKTFSRRLIRSKACREQLSELSDLIVLEENAVFSRCMNCNKILYVIDKNKIKTMVPGYVWENHDDFRICRKCGRVYWQGTHTGKIRAELEKIFQTGRSEVK